MSEVRGEPEVGAPLQCLPFSAAGPSITRRALATCARMRISSAMLVRDNLTSSAKGAFARARPQLNQRALLAREVVRQLSGLEDGAAFFLRKQRSQP